MVHPNPMRELNVSNDLQPLGIADHSLSQSMFEPIKSSVHDGIDMSIFNVVPTHTVQIETGVEALNNVVAWGELGEINMGAGMMTAAWDGLDGLAVDALPAWDESAFEQFMAQYPMDITK